MAVLTAIEPQRRRGRINLFVDGTFLMGAADRVVADLHLKIGQHVSEVDLRALVEAEEVHKASEAALRLLDVRARTRKEIETRLRSSGYEPATIDQVIAKLDRLGLIDDASFAEQWTEAKTREGASRPTGKRRIAMDLRAKGVDPEIIDTALQDLDTDHELHQAMAAAQKRLAKLPDDPALRRAELNKLAAFLQRRGFGWDTIKPVLQSADADTDTLYPR